jgi:hypothetical protein
MANKPHHVYIITCIAVGPDYHKQYVGITKTNPFARFGQHMDTARYRARKKPLHVAMAIYGPEDWTIEHVLCCRSEEDARAVEADMINALKTWVPNGFNLGGRGSRLTPEQREKRVEIMSTPERKAIHAKTMQQYWSDPANRVKHKRVMQAKHADPEFHAATIATLNIARDSRRRGPGVRPHRHRRINDKRQMEVL